MQKLVMTWLHKTLYYSCVEMAVNAVYKSYCMMGLDSVSARKHTALDITHIVPYIICQVYRNIGYTFVLIA